MSDKMTVEEIKFHRHFLDCYSLEEIQQETVKDICDTALSLHTDNERLVAEKNKWRFVNDIITYENLKLKAEVERLKEDNKKWRLLLSEDDDPDGLREER